MKNLIKQANKGWLIALTILFVLTIATSGYFIYSLFLYNVIEGLTVITLAVSFILLISYTLIFILSKSALIKRRTKACIVIAIILLIMSFGQFFTASYLERIFNMIEGTQERVSTFTTNIVVRTDSFYENPSELNDVVIGVINDPSNEDQTNAANTIVTDLNLSENNTIIEYDNFIEMISDLLNEEITAALLPGGYATTFQDSDIFENLESDLTTIYSRTFEVSNGLGHGGNIDEPFSVLIMGIDAVTEDIDRPDLANPDTLMLMTVNPITLHATILSIPRDSYVPISCMAGNRSDKIVHAGIGGKRCIVETVENFTDIPIDYYIYINFTGVVRITDALDGIEVDVPISFCEQDSQRRRGNHDICLEEGLQNLNGEQALALSRHRNTINDFERGYNNQLVLNALANEAKDVRDISVITQILQAVSDNMRTNFTTSEMLSLLDLARLGFGDRPMTMQSLYLSGFDAMIFNPSVGRNLYNFPLFNESIRAASNAMKENLGIRQPTMIKTFSFSAGVEFEVPEIGRGDFNRNDSTYDGRGMANTNQPTNTPTQRTTTTVPITTTVPVVTDPEDLGTLPEPTS